MNLSEVAALLAVAAAYDQRTIGEVDVHAWHDLLSDYQFADAREAIRRHYRETPTRVHVSHVIAGIRDVQRDRSLRALPQAVPAAPPNEVYETARAILDRTSAALGTRGLLRETRSLRCPWCGASPGFPCVALGSGPDVLDPKTGKVIGRGPDKPLRHTSGHTARHVAAGTGPANIDTRHLANANAEDVPW